MNIIFYWRLAKNDSRIYLKKVREAEVYGYAHKEAIPETQIYPTQLLFGDQQGILSN